ncbi:MAG: radical SAM protein [Deltaproteobacteria bacterium]|nr:radical SAM protein [Deltaproteobacteria bacterium]
MDITEITSKTALVRSRIPGVDYVINPFLGCAHGCLYCYAVFMRKYSRRHRAAAWGSFVEVKVNIVEVLRAELRRKRKPGRAMLASVCDPYQPVEKSYRLTRGCLEALLEFGWGIDILTRSPLVVRDLDILRAAPDVTVGFSITTDDDRVRRVLEPQAPPIAARLRALKQVYEAGIHTWVFVAPMLPLNPDRLYAAIGPYIHHLMVDPLNYRQQVRDIYRRHGWDYALTDAYAVQTGAALLRKWQDRHGQTSLTLA